MENFLMSLIFTKSKSDSNLYFKVESGRTVILMLYVDELFLTWEDELIVDAKRNISTKFKMKYLGIMHYFLGMEVWKSVAGIFLGQGKYVVEILKRFVMLDCKEMATAMASNLKLLCDASLEIIDTTIYD